MVARRLGAEHAVDVVTSLLAAHAVPPEWAGRQGGYARHVAEEILPQAAASGLADAVDAFSDRIAFTPEEAALVFDAMAYRLAREIASQVPAFDGEKVDQILLTGGMARSKMLTDRITSYVSAMECGVCVYPGENELAALVKGALRVLQGKEQAQAYVAS